MCMCYPIVSSLIYEMNLISMHYCIMSDCLICFPRKVIQLWNFDVLDSLN